MRVDIISLLSASCVAAGEPWVENAQARLGSLDTSKLPAGFGFAFEMKLTDTTENKSKPMIDRVTIEFE